MTYSQTIQLRGHSFTAGQLVFCVISNYLLYFYTDVYGLPVAIAGNIMLLARFADAIDAPIWGVIFDKTHSKWGKSRPWFLWLCLPFAVFGVLTFLTPNLGSTAKIIYAAGTYIVCSVLYTAGINTPVTSILSALTPDPRERVTLTSFRMFGSKLGVLLVNLTALKLVQYFGQGYDRKGFMIASFCLIYATGTILLYLFGISKSGGSRSPEKTILAGRGQPARPQRQLAMDHHFCEQPVFLDCIHCPRQRRSLFF